MEEAEKYFEIDEDPDTTSQFGQSIEIEEDIEQLLNDLNFSHEKTNFQSSQWRGFYSGLSERTRRRKAAALNKTAKAPGQLTLNNWLKTGKLSGEAVEEKKLATTAHRYLHPDCQALFVFDNSQNHNAKPPDALVSERLNLRDCGKNLKVVPRDGYFLVDGVQYTQPMSYETTKDGATVRVVKRIRRILEERGLWNDQRLVCKDTTKCDSTCCARSTLTKQADSLTGKSWLEEDVQDAGELMILLPKFHPEFNFIEMYWGACKRYTREHCD